MRTLRLRPFQYEKDLECLYAYMYDPAKQALFSHKFQCNTINAFERWFTEMLHTSYHDFFMIETAGQKTIGFTFSYEFFANDGHCKFTLCLFDGCTDLGYGVLAGAQMLDYLFSSYSLHQVFTTVFGYNLPCLSVHAHAGFRKLGELPNYRFYKGSYYSLHYYVMEREVFYQSAKKLLRVPKTTHSDEDRKT